MYIKYRTEERPTDIASSTYVFIKMDPFAYAKALRPWWEVPKHSFFHHICSLITSQEVRFEQGRKIRQALYKLCGGELTNDIINKLSDAQLLSTGLSPSRCETIRQLAQIDTKDVEAYAKIKGVGPWTIKGAKLLAGLDDHIILYEDKWIRQRVGQIIGKKMASESEVRNMFETVWKGNESLMSYFLWRIKSSGVTKLMRNQSLERSDFV